MQGHIEANEGRKNSDILSIRLFAGLFFVAKSLYEYLTLILLTCTIWRAPTNASKWRM